MNENQRAAMLFSQSVSAMIEAMGMVAENEQRKVCGQSMVYTEDSFQELILRSGVGCNDARKTLMGEN
jgi:hypothetical protein